MDYRSFSVQIEVDDGFNCPYCGRKIERLNVGFAKYIPEGRFDNALQWCYNGR